MLLESFESKPTVYSISSVGKRQYRASDRGVLAHTVLDRQSKTLAGRPTYGRSARERVSVREITVRTEIA